MHIACPTCNAAYEVPDRLIGAAGRQLRCAKCGHAWLVRPAEAAPSSPASTSPVPVSIGANPTGVAEPPLLPPLPIPPPPKALQAPAHGLPPPLTTPWRAAQVIDPPLPQQDDAPPRPAYALWAAWAASILLVILAVAALGVFREDIVAAWPPMARLYSALGLGTGG